MESQEGQFLKRKYWGSEEFRKAVGSSKLRSKGTKITPKTGESFREARERMALETASPEDIGAYLQRLERVTSRIDPKTGERGKLFLETALYPRYVIKPENISDEYIKSVLLGNFAEQRGYERDHLRSEEVKQRVLTQFKEETGQDFASYQISEKEREQVKEMVITDQKSRLKQWFEYLTSEEAKNVPAAFRYWAFAEMLKLGSFDEKRKVFNKRTEYTVASFPELDQQALALVFDEIMRKYEGEPSHLAFEDESWLAQFRKYLQSENFGRLYAAAIEHLKSLRLSEERLMITAGEWRHFPQGSSAKEVVSSLQAFHTGWCIAGEGYAQNYLSHSDLWIYYSKDVDGNCTIPRACIVHSKKRGITEVRGILSDENGKQHLDGYITPIVEAKLKTLPGGEKWQTTMEDMKKLTQIYLKYLQNEELTKEDLRFIYEIDRPIKSFGYGRDPRIEEIRKRRNIKKDLSLIFNVPPERISVTKEEALKGNIIFHYGDLDLRGLTSAEGLKLPESIGGDLYLNSLTSAEGLKLPESIGGSLYLDRLTSAKGLKLPVSIGGILDLRSLTSAEGLKLPVSIGGSLYLDRLTSAEGLKLPESIGGDLYLNSLTSAEGLKLPESIGGDLDLRSLTSAEKAKLRRNNPHMVHKIE